MKKTISKTLNLYLIVLFFSSCAEKFLDEKRNIAQVTPTAVGDYQALLNNTVTMMYYGITLNLIGAEEYTVADNVYDLLSSQQQKNAYIWLEQVNMGEQVYDWDYVYKRILYANTVLDGIDDVPEGRDTEEWRNVKGYALFHRAFAFYQLAQTFCVPFNEATASSDLGIPLRLEADIEAPITRARLIDVYDQIIADLRSSVELLPDNVPVKTRPTKLAAIAMISKVYLTMQDYGNALSYADRCIGASGGLMDYNGINSALRYPFSPFQMGNGNSEVLFYHAEAAPTIMGLTRFILDETLYGLYDENDLRKTAFFFPTRGTFTFKGSYTGSSLYFCGVALDEIVLVRAECLARMGDITGAASDVNYLLENRYDNETFVDLTWDNEESILRRIFQERRKELLCRGIRWEDLRRLNREDRFAETLTRTLNGGVYTLLPNSPRYTWPIPDLVIEKSGLEQNTR